jgi:enoyl-CoA hydratase
MPEALVRLDVSDAVATVTLDSPHNRNALSRALVGQLLDRLAVAATDEQVRAVVLTHTGTTFCAGADLTEMARGDTTVGAQNILDVMRAIVDAPKPVLARLTGHARAGGIGLVGACDVAIATPDATFAFTEVRLGLAPAMISLTTRSRLSDRSVGRYYLTGETFDAAEAARIGLLTEHAENVDTVVARYLDAFRLASPQGLRETKAIAAAPIRRALGDDGAAMLQLSGRLFASPEAAEGMQAFGERRSPWWTGETAP